MRQRVEPSFAFPSRSFHYLQQFRSHVTRRRCAGHGSLLKFTSTRAALARPGPGACPFPDVTARMRPSDSLAPVGLGFARPLPSAYLAAGASSVPCSGRQRVRPQTRCASECCHRISVAPVCSRGGAWASQISGPSSSCVPWSKTPPGAALPSPNGGGAAAAFRRSNALGTRKVMGFVAAWPTAHTLAGGRVPTHRRTMHPSQGAGNAARLSSGPGGLTLDRVGTGRVSHPLDDIQGFLGSSHASILPDQPCLVASRTSKPGVPGGIRTCEPWAYR